jgi:hypothetical protein
MEVILVEPTVEQPTAAAPIVEPTMEVTLVEPTVEQPTVAEPTVAEPTVAEPTVAEPTVAVILELTVVELTVVEPTVEPIVEVILEGTVVEPAVEAIIVDKSGPSLILTTPSFCSSTTKRACSRPSKMSLFENCVSTPVYWLNWELFPESRLLLLPLNLKAPMVLCSLNFTNTIPISPTSLVTVKLAPGKTQIGHGRSIIRARKP